MYEHFVTDIACFCSSPALSSSLTLNWIFMLMPLTGIIKLVFLHTSFMLKQNCTVLYNQRGMIIKEKLLGCKKTKKTFESKFLNSVIQTNYRAKDHVVADSTYGVTEGRCFFSHALTVFNGFETSSL